MQKTTLTGGRGWLDAPAAASLHRIDAQLGRRLDINEAGRSNARQWQLWNAYYRDGLRVFEGMTLGPPARPGTSPHERGNAIDTDDTQHAAVLRDHGWRDLVPGEPWHYVYHPALDNHRHPIPEEDDMPITILERKNNSNAAKSLYDPKTGRAVRRISKDENTSYRAAQASGGVVYVTVSDAEYEERGGK